LRNGSKELGTREMFHGREMVWRMGRWRVEEGGNRKEKRRD
jgi:hypothetical protein